MDIINPYIHGGESVPFDGFGNGSRSFNGVDDYVEIANDVDAVLDSSFTISFWLKLDDGQPASTQQWFGVDNGQNIARILVTTGGVVRGVYRSGGGTVSVADLATSLTNGQQAWVHYAWVVTPTVQKIYVDGLEATLDGTNDGDMSGNTMGDFTTVLDFYIGARNLNGSADQFTAGNYADFRIYDADIGANEVANLATGTNITTNLVGHWLKDTPSLLDHAGNNDATNYGSKFSYDNPSPAVEFGSMSRLFNGTSDYIDLGNSTDFSFSDTVQDEPFSLCAWIKCADNARFRVLSKDNGTGSSQEWLLATDAGGNLNVYLIGGGTFRGREYTTPLPENEWIHVASTYDGSGGENFRLGLKLYVNGVQVDNADFGFGGYVAMDTSTNNKVFIGRYGTTYSDGKIADARIYDAELSSTDIASLYNGTNVTTNLIGHWLTNNDDADDYAGTNDGTNNGSTYSYDNPNALVEYGGASRAFSGSNQYIDIGDVDGSAWQGSNKKFSGSLWIKPFTVSSNAAIFNKAGNTSNQYEWTITRIGSEIRFIWAGTLNPVNYSLNQTTNSPLVAGEWMHFTFTYDGTQAVADRVKLYINGLQGTYSHTLLGSPSEIQNGTQPLCIGGEWVSNGNITNDYRGNIADVRLYDKELTSTEAYELYKGVDHRTNLIGQWLTNSDDVEDKAGTNDGTNYNSSYSTDSPL